MSASHRATDVPSNERQALDSDEPIRPTASTVLDEIRADMDADVYRSALARGETESFDWILNELLGRGTGSLLVSVRLLEDPAVISGRDTYLRDIRVDAVRPSPWWRLRLQDRYEFLGGAFQYGE